ncbi:ATP-binding domain-containing protein [Streptomyces pactum]|uniref:ATP-dependent DNA helicase n=1 Tax=Streptomyces pactum TaxID=68249 RepID=A0A1S6J9H5_9ACTN|nr:ATP-binding domain-containing protein [Streptomyces pactum]AQS68422.1 ATP-dependent DNA helicase [Streptomyces pactum]
MSTTTRDAAIAAEQKAVDRAYACYEARLAELTGPTAATASASGKDSIAVRKEAEATAESYGGLGGAALVVSRVDVQEPGDAEPETFHVGRRSVFDPENRDQVVVNWTNPIAVRWHNALPEAPGEVLLRRQLRCVERTVEDYRDEINRAGAAQAGGARPGVPTPDRETAVPGPPDEDTAVPETAAHGPGAPDEAADRTGEEQPSSPRPAPSPREVPRRQRRKPQPVDDFLLRELRRSRGGRMRDIVETIRRDQMALVTGAPADILVIQGGPGTGKSAVGLHRVTWLVNNGHFPAQDILVVGPHQNFLDYVGRVLPTLGTRDVTAVQRARLWEGEIRGADSVAARLVKSDERMAAVLRRRVESECRPEALDSLVSAPSHAQDEAAFVVTVGSLALRLPRSEVLGLLQDARQGAGAYRVRRDRFRTLLVDRLLSELVRIAPRRSRDRTVRRDLERNRQVTALVERTWPALSPEEALRSLLDSRSRLRECAATDLDEEEQAALRRPRADNADDDPWTQDDLVCLEELRFLIAGDTPQRYRHIVVDEAQDLTPMQARSLRRRCPTGSMTVLGDLAQATGPHAYTNWERLGGLLSDHGDWRVAELNTSYRVPAEIMEFVAPLARAVAPSLPYPTAVRVAGDDAVRLVPTNPWDLLEEATARAARLVGTDDGQSLRSIAVVVPDDSDWLDEVRRRVHSVEGMTEEELRTVFVLPAVQAKGMEFDHVLVLEPSTIADRGPAGLRQLYVALTRSTQTLTVLHTTPLPRELGPTDEDDDASTSSPSSPSSPSAPGAASPPATAGTSQDTRPRNEGELPVGTPVKVRVLGPGPGAHWKVKALAPATERTLLLVSRHGEPAPKAGSRLEAWVTRNEGPVSLVAAGDFGRKPISARMAPRYLGALGALQDIVEGHGTVPPGTADRLSELKGMANRCLRRDRVDWLSVWRLLGSVDRERLSALADLAQRTRHAVTSRTPDLSTALAADPVLEQWAGPLAQAREELSRGFDGEPAPRTETGTEPARTVPHDSDPARQDGDGTETDETPATGQATSSQLATRHEHQDTYTKDTYTKDTYPKDTHTMDTYPKDTHTMDTAAPTDTSASEPTGQPAFGEALARALGLDAEADRVCNTHEAVRFELKAALLRAGLRPSDSSTADVVVDGPKGFFLYEVLGAGRSAYADLRAGAARLMELEHLSSRAFDHRFLVLSEPPTDDWAAGALKDIFGVGTVWRALDGWQGPDARIALHSPD